MQRVTSHVFLNFRVNQLHQHYILLTGSKTEEFFEARAIFDSHFGMRSFQLFETSL